MYKFEHKNTRSYNSFFTVNIVPLSLNKFENKNYSSIIQCFEDVKQIRHVLVNTILHQLVQKCIYMLCSFISLKIKQNLYTTVQKTRINSQ